MLGTNPITKVERYDDPTAWDGQIAVHSLFYTIQGECVFSGMPAVFIRLQHCNLACQFCFAADTAITMADGTRKPIAAVAVGDAVMAFDEATGKRISKPVTRVMQRTATDTVQLHCSANGPPLSVTAEHPLWVVNRGWVAAGQLAVGNRLLSGDGAVSVTRVATMASPSIPVYNIEVADVHTYFANQILVHNCDTEFTTGERRPIADVVQQADALWPVQPRHHPPASRKLAVITGGEPCIHYGLTKLIGALLAHGFWVQLETAGTVVPAMPGDDRNFLELFRHTDCFTVVCSPKTARIPRGVGLYVDHWKYVIFADAVCPDDGLPLYNFQTGQPDPAYRVQRPMNDNPVWVMPADEHDVVLCDAHQRAARDVALRFGYRLTLQTHKLIDVP